MDNENAAEKREISNVSKTTPELDDIILTYCIIYISKYCHINNNFIAIRKLA